MKKFNPKFLNSCVLIFISNLLFCSISLASTATPSCKQNSFYKNKQKNTSKLNCATDDWIVLPECYELGNKSCKKLCRGFYIEPEYPFPGQGADVEDQPIEITADKVSLKEKGTSIFTGNVIAVEGNKTIKSDIAHILHNENTGELENIYCSGNVNITAPSQRIYGDQASYLFKDDIKIVKNARFRLYDRHARGTSSELKSEGANFFFLPNATYTTCAPNDTVWKIKAKKINLNRETGRGQAWHTTLHVKDVPVFYWPYLNFPIDNRRQTGFLQPLIKSSSSYGPHIIIPYYLNLAPNYDATITPYFTHKRKIRLFNEFRYLTNNTVGAIKFDYLPRDIKYTKFREESLVEANDDPIKFRPFSPRVAGLKDTKDRYAYSIKHNTDFTENLSFNIDYTKIGDDNFIDDIGPEILQQNNFIDSSFITNDTALRNTNLNTQYDHTLAVLERANLRYRHKIGTISSLVQKYQILNPFSGSDRGELYQKLPEIKFNSTAFDLPQDIMWRLDSSYTHFKIKDVPFRQRKTFGKRYYLRPTIYKDMRDGGWFIKPSAKLHYINYDLHQGTKDIENLAPGTREYLGEKPNSPKKSIPIFDLDTGLIFERDISLYNRNFIQTLEPRIYFLYVPNKDQDDLPLFDTAVRQFDYNQLFRDNRYTGYDRVSEAKQITFALSTKFLTDTNNEERGSFSIGQIYYLKDREEREGLNERIYNDTNRSPIACLLKYRIFKNWELISNFVYDEPQRKINTGNLTFNYKPSKYNVFNMGYSFNRSYAKTLDPITERKRHIRQAYLSSAIVLSRHLRVIGKISYDLQRKNLINAIGGFEHYGCCTNFRFIVMRSRTAIRTLSTNRKYETSIGFQIVFKGLGGTGSISPASIGSAIRGYEAPLNNEF